MAEQTSPAGAFNDAFQGILENIEQSRKQYEQQGAQNVRQALEQDYAPSGVTFPVAYRGQEITKANLVLEGGAMRDFFSAGVIDVFLDRGLFCDTVIGTSAGSLCGYNYVGGFTGRTAYINLKYCIDWRYLSLRSFMVTGNAFNRDFSFDLIPNKFDPVDYEAFNESPMRLIAVSSDLDRGEADYHEVRDGRTDIPYIIASSSMPLVSETVEIDGKHLLDGGPCDSIPIIYSMLTGARKHIVVCTQDGTYRKKANKLMPLMWQRYANYPAFLERMKNRHIEYNRTCRMLEHMHEEGEAFLIRPQKPVEVANMETSQARLLDLYEQGVEEAVRVWDDLQDYLARP